MQQINGDIIICMEFKQILGPAVVFTIPQQICLQGFTQYESDKLINQIVLHIMTIKFDLKADSVTKSNIIHNYSPNICSNFKEPANTNKQCTVKTQQIQQIINESESINLSINHDNETKNKTLPDDNINKHYNSQPYALLTSDQFNDFDLQEEKNIKENHNMNQTQDSKQKEKDVNQVNDFQQIKNQQSYNENQNQYTNQQNENKMPFNEDQYAIFEIQHLPGYFCLAYFTYLPDLSARGYTRRLGLAYITNQYRKISDCCFNIAGAFQQSILCLKYVMTIAYRKDVIFYCNQLDQTLKKIKESDAIQQNQKANQPHEREATSPIQLYSFQTDENNINVLEYDSQKQLRHIQPRFSSDDMLSNDEVKDKNISQIKKIKYDLINEHIALHMAQVPFLFQLYQEENVIQQINADNCAVEVIQTVYNNIDDDNGEIVYIQNQNWQPEHIIPKNWKNDVMVPPYELRLIKRQELRSIEQIVGKHFFQYFYNLLKRMHNYYSQEYIDLQHDIQQQQYDIYQILIDDVKGVYCGQKLFIPVDIDENFLLNYKLPNQHAFNEININIQCPQFINYLQNERYYDVELQTNTIGSYMQTLTIYFPFEQVCDKYYIRFHQMFTYLDVWTVPRLCNLSTQRPSYGHLFQMVVNYMPEKHFKSLITYLLLGFKVVILTDFRWWAVILQEVLETFILGRKFQEQHSIVLELTSPSDVGLLDAQLTVMYWQPAAAAVAAVQREIIARTPAPVLYEAAVGSHKSFLAAAPIKSTIVDDIITFSKTTPTPLAVSRFIETCLRVLVAQAKQFVPYGAQGYEQGTKQLIIQQKTRFGDNIGIIERLFYIINTQKSLEHEYLKSVKKEELKVGDLQQSVLSSGVSIHFDNFQ